MAKDHDHATQAIGEPDIGHMYTIPWVHNLIRRIRDILRINADVLGLDSGSLDESSITLAATARYLVIQALLEVFPHAMFHGLDIDASQVGRYNTAAAERAGFIRMHAIQGDLIEPLSYLNDSDWQDFDAAITSMALHHVKGQVFLLSRMAERVKPGGSIVIVDFICPAKDSGESKLATLPQGEIWLRFSRDQTWRYMQEAGCTVVEILEFDCDAGEGAPKEMEGLENIFIAKATVL